MHPMSSSADDVMLKTGRQGTYLTHRGQSSWFNGGCCVAVLRLVTLP
jgi:hypothetical protein